MAQNRPDKPQITLPDDFGGTQEPFSSSLVESGYEASIPQIIEGGNLNWMLNGFFQNTKYMRTVLDYVRDTPSGKMFWVNSQGKMDYIQPAIIATNTEFSTGTATDKTPNVKQVVDKFATKANDNSVVHIAGTETVTGKKTFTNDCDFNKTIYVKPTETSGVTVQNTVINKGTAPTSEQGNVAARFLFNDKNGNTNTYRLGEFNLYYSTSGITAALMMAYRPVSGVNTAASIGVYYPPTGSPYTQAPTPTTLSDSTMNGKQIVTLGYLDTSLSAKANDNAVVKLTGSQTIAGSKTFSNTIVGSINGNAATVTNGVYTTGNQTIGGTKTFSSSPVIPTLATTDNSTKAASTAWVKSLFTYDWSSTDKSGYTMIADKLIIQRGYVTEHTSTGYWDILFETPFGNTNYSIVAMTRRTDNVGSYALMSATTDNERKTTGCRIMASGVAANVGFDWIAVGYK